MRSGIRKTIVAEAGRQGLSANTLAMVVAGKVSRSLVYDFLSGKHDLTTEKADHLLEALGLKIVRQKNGPLSRKTGVPTKD